MPVVFSLLAALRDLVFPPRCLACDVFLTEPSEPPLCAECLPNLPLLSPPYCPGCGDPFPAREVASHLCGHCLQDSWAFDSARSLCTYGDPVARLIHALKYAGRTHCLPLFAHLFRQHPDHDRLAGMDRIAAVPLHAVRLRERGFNQALLAARALLPDRRDRLVPDLLIRPRPTEPQTGLSGRVRRQNLRGAFRLSPRHTVAGQTVLLVDDVYTTGTTVNECARALKKAGARAVHVLTLARSPART